MVFTIRKDVFIVPKKSNIILSALFFCVLYVRCIRYQFGPSFIAEQLGESFQRKDVERKVVNDDEDKRKKKLQKNGKKKHGQAKKKPETSAEGIVENRPKKENEDEDRSFSQKYGIPILSAMGALVMAGCFIVFAVAALVVSTSDLTSCINLVTLPYRSLVWKCGIKIIIT